MKDAFEALVESQASYEQFELSADENKESVNTASRGWTPLILVSEKFVDDALSTRFVYLTYIVLLELHASSSPSELISPSKMTRAERRLFTLVKPESRNCWLTYSNWILPKPTSSL